MFLTLFRKIILRFIAIPVFCFLTSGTLFTRSVLALDTALGNITPTPEGFAKWFLENGIRMAGGIAFLFMIYGGFLFMTSAGDPNKLQEATDVITSAIAGLLMIIFSVFILELLGYKVLLIF